MVARTILFSGHDFRFLRPYIEFCRSSPHYRVLIEEHEGHVLCDTAKARCLLGRADVVFCEWALDNAVWYSRQKAPHQLLIVRLHHQEMNLRYLDEIAWDAVDALVLICPQHLTAVTARYPCLKHKATLIYNPIDCCALDRPKLPGAEFNLGFMGLSPMRKAPHRAFAILERLKRIDGRFTLFVKGKPPWEYRWLWSLPEERAYYERFFARLEQSGLANSVVFESYGDDVADWFSKVGFILSTSDHEGSHQAVAEGMASGSIPIIRNWDGADRLYPNRFVFTSEDHAVHLAERYLNRGEYSDEADRVKRFAREHFDQRVVIDRLEQLVVQLTFGKRAMPLPTEVWA